MKFFLTILAVVLMVQIALGASVSRLRRSNEVEEAVVDVMKLGRHLVTFSENVGKELVEAMPKTDEFANFNHDLEEYLKEVDEYKTQPGNCILKTAKVLRSLFTFYAKYDDSKEESSEETNTELEEFLKKHGAEQLTKDIEDFQKKYDTEEFRAKLNNVDESEDKWAVENEVC